MTGGSRGIRYEVVRLLVALGAHVIIGTLSSHVAGQACMYRLDHKHYYVDC